jgi:fatty-acyl-CoA synthase
MDPVALARRQALGDLLRRSAKRYADRLAVADDGVRRTYAELDADANRVANALIARGIGKGDRVALLARNSVQYAQAIFGVARTGAVLVPVNFMLGAEEVRFVLDHAKVDGLLAQSALLDTAREAAGDRDLKVRAVLDGDGDWEAFTDLVAHEDATEPEVAIGPDDPAQVLYTSGTESRPKGAVLAHSALYAQYASVVIDGGMDAGDVELHSMPLFHCAQQHCFLLPNLQLGGVNHILPAPDPGTLLERIERDRITKLFVPPTVWIGLLRHPDFDTRDLSSLRKGYYGAAIMPVEIIRELGRRLPDMRLWNFYGQTEMAPLALILRPEEQVEKAGAAGKASLNVETRVVRPDMTDVDVGEEGEIVHRSPHATLGYLDQPEKTAEAFAGGWFHSGDLGTIDADGYITVVDRIKDMIKTGGENVASREVEEVLYEHDAVAEVAVIGIRHPTWIEAVVAVVQPREGQAVEPDELRAHARERLAGFKVPKAVAFVDAMPKNASGKLLKRDLREQFAHLAEDIT